MSLCSEVTRTLNSTVICCTGTHWLCTTASSTERRPLVAAAVSQGVTTGQAGRKATPAATASPTSASVVRLPSDSRRRGKRR